LDSAFTVSLVAIVTSHWSSRKPAILAVLGDCPDSELAFSAFAVGVLGGVEDIVWAVHLACKAIQRFQGDCAEKPVPAELPRVEINAGKLGIVAQHALKVGRTVQYVRLPDDGAIGVGTCSRHRKRKALRASCWAGNEALSLPERDFGCIVSSSARPLVPWTRKGTKDELPAYAPADDRSDIDRVVLGWVRRSCGHLHPSPVVSHPNPTDRYTHSSPTNCG
jgi:hypothetical protein